MLVNDAYKVLTSINSTEIGREAFIANRGINVLTQLNIRQGFQDEEALDLLLDILTYERDKCWSYHNGYQDAFNLVQHISDNYNRLSCCEDIDISDIIDTVLRTLPSSFSFSGRKLTK